jgi:hypothetical protein
VALSKEIYPIHRCEIGVCHLSVYAGSSKTGRGQTSRSGPLPKKPTAPVKILFTGTDDALDVTCRQMLACAGNAVLDVQGCKGLHH